MNRQVETPLPALALGELASKSHKLGTILDSQSRAAATYTTDPIHNYEAKGLRLFFDLTNVGAGPGTVTAKVQVQDPVSGNWVDLAGAVTAALNAVGTTMLTIYPGLTAAANVAVSSPLGLVWRLSVTVATNAVSFSVGGQYLN
jgi:hypothetical protein